MFLRSAGATLGAAIILAVSPAAIDQSTTLEPGKPITHALAGGESHLYQLAVPAGQHAVLTVEQRGIDVVVRVSDPSGAVVADFDADSRRVGEEHPEIFSEAGGTYQLKVSARYPRDPVASYDIRVDEIRSATDRDRTLDAARRLHYAAEQFRAAGKYDDALKNLTRALQLAEDAAGPHDPYVATLVTVVGLVQRALGDFAHAEQSYRRAIGIFDETLGREHPRTAGVLSFLANMLTNRDDYAAAEPMMLEAIGILERTLGPDHPRVAAVLADLGDLHSYRGDKVRARAELERAYVIGERTLDANDFARMALVNNLGALYVGIGEYDLAEPLIRRALESIEQRFGVENVRVSNPLLSLSIIARERAHYDEALTFLDRAYEVREKTLGSQHPETASILITKGNIYNAAGEYAQALAAFQRARDVLETAVGPYHSLTLLTLVGTTRTFAAQGNVPRAVEYQARSDEVLEKSIDFNLAIGSARAKLTFADFVQERTGRTISLALNQGAGDQSAADLAALVLLQRKGRVQDAMSGSLTALRQRLNEGDRALLDQLSSTTRQLATLALSGPGKTPFADYRGRLASLEEQRGDLEAKVSERSAEFRSRSRPITLASVQSLIPADAALVEFAVYTPFDPKGRNDDEAHKPLRYAACVLTRDGRARWKDLGAASDVDGAVHALRQALRDVKSDPQSPARALDQLVMAPLRPLIGDAQRLLIAPDGALNLVPFEALVDDGQRYLIERYAVTYLTTGRDLLRLQVARSNQSGPLVIADALFGEPAASSSTARPLPPRPPARSARRSIVQADSLASVYFAPLAATGNEARAIKALFPDARLLTGAQATKTALAGVDAPLLLHIATHGFFLSATAAVENPLLRSGLAFAGANVANDRDGRGILTALEATNLNLWGTRLVTLSACDTGVGEVKNGEGVYGLRRAFFLAGAETLVMSLWPVSDVVSHEVMSAYYRGLRDGLGRGEALREAQLALLARAGRHHPFYWASFIQAGEWANLDGVRSAAEKSAAAERAGK